jgi:hypothetical protein
MLLLLQRTVLDEQRRHFDFPDQLPEPPSCAPHGGDAVNPNSTFARDHAPDDGIEQDLSLLRPAGNDRNEPRSLEPDADPVEQPPVIYPRDADTKELDHEQEDGAAVLRQRDE